MGVEIPKGKKVQKLKILFASYFSVHNFLIQRPYLLKYLPKFGETKFDGNLGILLYSYLMEYMS